MKVAMPEKRGMTLPEIGLNDCVTSAMAGVSSIVCGGSWSSLAKLVNVPAKDNSLAAESAGTAPDQ